MSGGTLNYRDRSTKLEIFNYCGDDSRKVPDVFNDREISEVVWDVFELIHDFDWYQSGDIQEGDWNLSVKRFKDKWFSKEGKEDRYKKYIDDSIKELKEVLGIDVEYCCNCGMFTEKEDSNRYGKCKNKKKVLVNKWEKACKDFIKDTTK